MHKHVLENYVDSDTILSSDDILQVNLELLCLGLTSQGPSKSQARSQKSSRLKPHTTLDIRARLVFFRGHKQSVDFKRYIILVPSFVSSLLKTSVDKIARFC